MKTIKRSKRTGYRSGAVSIVEKGGHPTLKSKDCRACFFILHYSPGWACLLNCDIYIWIKRRGKYNNTYITIPIRGIYNYLHGRGNR